MQDNKKEPMQEPITPDIYSIIIKDKEYVIEQKEPPN